MTEQPIEIEVAPEQAGLTKDDVPFVDHLGHDDPVESCGWCETRVYLPLIHDRYQNGTPGEFDLIWSLADGYGAPGTIPAQGYDWSGVRDSSPAAVRAIYKALTA